jgi:hypothetical protein
MAVKKKVRAARGSGGRGDHHDAADTARDFFEIDVRFFIEF